MAKYTLVIDQGGKSTRAIVFNKNGEPIAYSSEPVDEPMPNTIENHIGYDIDRIVESTHLMLERLIEQLSPEKALKIKSVALIAQRSSIVACDKNGKALTTMISWQDMRHEGWLENQAFDQEALQKLTGLRNNPHMGASKIRWLLDNDTVVKQHADQNNLIFMPWGAYFLQRLRTNTLSTQDNISLVTDPILAARTGLVEYQQFSWSVQLLKKYGISKKYLPKITPTSHHYGELCLSGITIPIRLLGGDQNFIPCAYGTSHIKKNIFLNVGTGAFIQAHFTNNKPHRLLKTGIAIEKTPLSEPEGKPKKIDNNNLTIIEGTVNAAATALDWWQAQLPRPFSYTEIDQIIDRNEIAPLFINALSGSGSPYWLSPQAPVFLSTNTITNNKKYNIDDYNEEQKTLAVIESILFACKINIDIICKLNKKLKYIIISGGLARSNSICQILTDLTEMTVKRYNDSEASARGVAFYLINKKKYKPSIAPTLFQPNKEIRKNDNPQKRFLLYCREMEKRADTKTTTL
ncbi:MAG: glycerol kinase [Cellvibrionaceae bacterium]|jgi:glycerol kinase